MADEGEEQAPVRIPLSVATTPRNADLTKDALLQNAFIDGSQMGNKYVVKRPGFYVGSEAITTGNNRGIYVNPNNVSGGTPGEVEVWYIPSTGGGNLTSFAVSDEPPPADVFRDYSFTLFVGPSFGPGDASSAQEGINAAQDEYIRAGYFDNGGTPTMVFEYLANGVPGGQDIPVTLNGTYLMEVKLETGNFNLYQDSVLVASVADPGFGLWSDPTLISSDTNPTNCLISNLQFI